MWASCVEFFISKEISLTILYHRQVSFADFLLWVALTSPLYLGKALSQRGAWFHWGFLLGLLIGKKVIHSLSKYLK